MAAEPPTASHGPVPPGLPGRRGRAAAWMRRHPLLRHALARAAQAVAALWVVVTLTFVLMHALPGDPFASLQSTPAVRALLDARYGLDLSLPRQYAIYVGNLLHGHLGWSLIDPHRTVGQEIRSGGPVSAALGAEALAWSVPGGVLLGLLAAARRGGAWDRASSVVGLAGMAVPNFVLATAADYLLGVRARLLPVAGWGTAAQTVLPALALGALPCALVSRMIRAEAADVLAADFVRAARAKGLTGTQILLRHVLRNALTPVLTLLGPLVTATVAGSFVVETVFAIPGLGASFVNSVLDRDYPLILGLTIFYSTVLLALNAAADVAAALADPRIDPARGPT